MSERYPGGLITKTPVTPTGGPEGTAPGVWTLAEALPYIKTQSWPTPLIYYIEDVFSTYIYTGNSTTGGTQTITNGINLSSKGGMVWIKGRSAASNHVLFDTLRGAGSTASNNQALSSNLTNAEDLGASYDFLSAFNTNGFTVTQGGTTTATRGANYNAVTYSSWAFRKAPKFFDVVTWTGDGTAGRTVSHNLGSVPGCIIVKRVSAAYGWCVWHRGFNSGNGYGFLNTTAAFTSGGGTFWGNGTTYAAPTSAEFTVSSDPGVNASGSTYVAYLFAHDAGGFGDSGTDNVVSCGSFTGSNINNVDVTLGYEPQWIFWKSATSADSWKIADNIRGMPIGSGLSSSTKNLFPNNANIEATENGVAPTATGFTWYANGAVAASDTYIYIAIRRGPMKTPTSGTQIFSPVASSAGVNTPLTTGFPIDMTFEAYRAGTGTKTLVVDRMRGFQGGDLYLNSRANDVENNGGGGSASGWNNTGFLVPAFFAGISTIYWNFRRSPGFFDIVCYTGNGSNRTITHGLGAVPELIFVKDRNVGFNGRVYSAAAGNTKTLDLFSAFTTNAATTSATTWNNTSPTSTVFTVGTENNVNYSTGLFVAYLFASVPGVSKVGSYTGTGTTQQINCGFTAGARFILIKRIDSTGDWYVWDSARGIVAGNDPYLLWNQTDAEVTTTDYVDTYSQGFEISSTAPAAINANGGTFIFLAIA